MSKVGRNAMRGLTTYHSDRRRWFHKLDYHSVHRIVAAVPDPKFAAPAGSGWGGSFCDPVSRVLKLSGR
jgi:hypothetical protein